jgi:hypothetical protein
MSNGSDTIIIKGGSAEVVFDSAVFVQDPNDPNRHKNQNKKITRVVITGGITFDSDEHPNGLTCSITATCT